MPIAPLPLQLFSPAGVVLRAEPLRRARHRLEGWGFVVEVDSAARYKNQRFAGSDAERLDAIMRVAEAAPSVALATRGGYGLTRLLDAIDWGRIAKSVEHGTRWVGHSDVTALHLGLLAHANANSWAGPMAVGDFGRTDAEGGIDEVTRDCFLEAMRGELEGVGFRTEAGFDGVHVKGRLWGGNLAMLCSLLGTPHWPKIRGGVLFLEDVNEHPYRIERSLLQLHQAGVLGAQKAVVLGAFNAWKRSPMDRGYGLKAMVEHVRSITKTPVLTGLPFGHVPTKVSLPIGALVEFAVEGRNAWLAWGHSDKAPALHATHGPHG